MSEKYVLAVYFGRKDILRSVKNTVLRVLLVTLPTDHQNLRAEWLILTHIAPFVVFPYQSLGFYLLFVKFFVLCLVFGLPSLGCVGLVTSDMIGHRWYIF